VTSTVHSRALRGQDAARAFTSEWDELAGANPRATVFQTGGWYLAWIEAVAAHEAAEPLVLRVPATGKARAAIALQVGSTGGRKLLRPLSYPWADYHEAVGSPSDGAAIESLARALAELMDEEGCPLVLDDVVPGGSCERMLTHLPASSSLSSHTCAVDLTDAAHVRGVLDSNEHATKLRRLERLGSVRCEHHVGAGAILRRLPNLVELHNEHWAGRADAVAPFDDAVIVSAFEAMTRHLAPRGLVVLTELLLGDEPIAMYFGFAYGRRYGAYRTAFGGAHRRLSPGHLMLRKMIVDFAAAGFRELDLMRGDYSYKHEYANRFRRNRRFELRDGRAT
jgi:CelD/BcsL family acetyltransferase involved in cellulose biosynthesis